VLKVVIANGRATSVDLLRRGIIERIDARCEVILSGGAYNSPQLLMLSGIGPAAELAAQNIIPLVDLPGVGANLIEHPTAKLSFSTDSPTFVEELRMDRAIVSAFRWATSGSGPFATNGANGMIFFRTDLGEDRPDIQVMCTGLPATASLWYPGSSPSAQGFGAIVTLLRQESRGRVSLQSGDPLQPPRIALNLLFAPRDLGRVIAGIRITREIYAQEPLKSRHTMEQLPGANLTTDAELAHYIRANMGTAHHPVGTCKMGNDENSVVDADLKVRGVSQLRVVDASVMPTIPGGNTNAPTIMVAEKAADRIRGREALASTRLELQSRSA